MQTYLEDYSLYGFNWQKTSKASCMVENFLTSQKHPKHDKSYVKYRDNILAKSWLNVKLLIISH